MKRMLSTFIIISFINMTFYPAILAAQITKEMASRAKAAEAVQTKIVAKKKLFPVRNIAFSRSAKGVKVLWNAEAFKGATHLEIAREPAFADGTKIVRIDKASYMDSDVNDGNEYTYTVSSIDSDGNKTPVKTMKEWYGSKNGTALAGTSSRVEYDGFNLAFKGTEFKKHKKMTVRISPNTVEEDSLIQASELYEVTLEDEEQPAVPVTAEISYNTINMPKGYSEKDLKVFLRHNAQTKWEFAKIIKIDKDKKIIYAAIPHFSEIMAGFVGAPEESQTRANVNTAMPKIKLQDPFVGKMRIGLPQPNLLGALNQKIPIDLPQGISGMTPDVSLVYSSDQKNGLCGYGWALAAGDCISYVKKNGNYIYTTSAGDLTYVSGQFPFATYRLTNDNSFAKYISAPNGEGGNMWMVIKDGYTNVYGENGSIITGNLQGSQAKQWLLTTKYSPDNVAIHYNYLTTSGNEMILDYIQYGNFKVQMQWGQRSDSFSYTSSIGYYTMQEKLVNIQIYDNLSNGTYQLDRRYVLSYGQNDVGNALLTKIELDYSDGTPLSEVTMTYKVSDYSFNTSPQVFNASNIIAEDNQNIMPMDINGDGLKDIIALMDGTANTNHGKFKVYLNNGNGFTTNYSSIVNHLYSPYYDIFQTNNSIPMENIHFMDMNCDGKPDLVVYNYGSTGLSSLCVYTNTGNGFLQDNDLYLNVGVDPTRFSIMDMNGDGKPDFVINRTGLDEYNGVVYETYTNSGSSIAQTAVNWQCSVTIDPADPAMVGLKDLTGDGIPDLIIQSNDSISNYWLVFPNNGSGFYSTATTFSVPSTDPQFTSWMDINGDGMQELIVNSNTGFIYVYRNNGYSLSSSYEYWSAPITIPYGMSFQDINGDGKPDIVVNYQDTSIKNNIYLNTGNGFTACQTVDTKGVNPSQQSIIDMDGDGAADSVINNTNGTITMYKGKQNFNYLLNTMEANHCVISYEYDNVNNGLGFAKTVLKKATISNQLPTGSGYFSKDTFFTYEQGKYDQQNHVMYGFGKVTSSDTAKQSVTYFDQDSIEMSGHVLTNDSYISSTYIPFDGNANDVSGSGVNGTVLGSPIYIGGFHNNAILFAGNSDYVVIDPWVQNAKLWGRDSISIDFWARPIPGNNNSLIMDFIKGRGNDSGYLRLNQLDSSTIRFSGIVNGDIAYNWDPSQFHHFACSVTTTDVSLFIDGTKVFKGKINTSFLNTAMPYELVLGGEGDHYSTSLYKWYGAIDDLTIWSGKLVSRSINQYATQNLNTGGAVTVLLTNTANWTVSPDQMNTNVTGTEYQYYGLNINSPNNDANLDYLLYQKIDRQIMTGAGYTANADPADDVYEQYLYTGANLSNGNITPQLASSQSYMLSGTVTNILGKTQYYFVDGSDWGTMNDSGRVWKKREWNGTNASGVDKWMTTVNRYDSVDKWRLAGTSLYTNDTVMIKTADYSYDRTKRFVTGTSNTYIDNQNIVESSQSAVEPLWGLTLQVTNNNNQVSSYRYDIWNRVIAVYEPGDNYNSSIPQTGLTSISFTNSAFDQASSLYVYGSVDGCTTYTKALKRVNRNDTTTPFIESIAFLDGLGRTLQTKISHKDPATGNKDYVVSGVQVYDQMNRLVQSRDPVIVSANEALETYHQYTPGPLNPVTSVYDHLDRVLMTSKGSGASQITMSNLYIGLYTNVSFDAEGNIKEEDKDNYGRVKTIIDYTNQVRQPANAYATIDYSYDIRGNLTNTRDVNGNNISITYNYLNQKIAMHDPDMSNWTYTYDDLGRLAATTDAKGQISRQVYDAAGRMTGKTYDSDASLNVTYTYGTEPAKNNNGRLTSVSDSSGSEIYTYNENGEVIEMQKTIGGVSYFSSSTLDALGRVSTLTYPHTNPPISFDQIQTTNAWDCGGTFLFQDDSSGWPVDYYQKDFVFNKPEGCEFDISSLAGYSAGWNENEDGFNRVISNGDPWLDQNGNCCVSVFYTVMHEADNSYEMSAELTGSVHRNENSNPDAVRLRYSYEDYSGLLDKIEQIDPVGNVTKTYLQNIDYDAMGRRTSITYGNGVATSYYYDPVNTMLSDCHIQNSSLTINNDIYYFFDNMGNIIEKDDMDCGTTQYTYDSLYRLTSTAFTRRGSGPTGCDYFNTNSYNALGNIQTKDADYYNPASGNHNYVYNASKPHAVSQFTRTYQGNDTQYSFTYDANGSMSQETITGAQNAVKTFTWDSANRLSALSYQGTNWNYTYDYTGERVKKQTVQTSASTIYLGGMAQFTSTGSSVYSVYDGVNRIAAISAVSGVTTSFYMHTDNVGSTTMVTKDDGSVYQRVVYKSFGEILKVWTTSGWADSGDLSNIGSYAFTGQELDSETGLYYYGARYYDPLIGRFISADSHVDGDGLDTQGYNRYTYAMNNPIVYCDPSGYDAQWWQIFIAVMIIAVVVVASVLTAGLLTGAIAITAAGITAGSATGAALAAGIGAMIGAGIGAAALGAFGAYAGYQIGGVNGMYFGAFAGAVFGGIAGGFIGYGLGGLFGGNYITTTTVQTGSKLVETVYGTSGYMGDVQTWVPIMTTTTSLNTGGLLFDIGSIVGGLGIVASVGSAIPGRSENNNTGGGGNLNINNLNGQYSGPYYRQNDGRGGEGTFPGLPGGGGPGIGNYTPKWYESNPVTKFIVNTIQEEVDGFGFMFRVGHDGVGVLSGRGYTPKEAQDASIAAVLTVVPMGGPGAKLGEAAAETGVKDIVKTFSKEFYSNAEIIAKGNRIRDVERLVKTYGGKAKDWIKMKSWENGIEYHWYECNGIGKVEFKIK